MSLLFALFLGLAHADVSCTASDGSGWSYSEWGKSGGAHPGPDTVMAHHSWTLRGTTVFRHERTYMSGTTTNGELEWSWDAGATVLEPAVGSRMYGTQKYTTEVDIWGPKLPRRTVAMECVYTWKHGIP